MTGRSLSTFVLILLTVLLAFIFHSPIATDSKIQDKKKATPPAHVRAMSTESLFNQDNSHVTFKNEYNLASRINQKDQTAHSITSTSIEHPESRDTDLYSVNPSSLSEPANTSMGIWISPDELASLKMHGDAWEQLKKQAMQSAGRPDLSNNRQKNNVYVLAKALVYARCELEVSHKQCRDLDLQRLYEEIVDQIMMAIGTEKGGSTLALGRELAAYVIAADLVGLPGKKDKIFRSWLSNVRHSRPDSKSKKTLISTHEERPNNWGTHAGASRVAIAVYLGDKAEIRRSVKVFKGWLGDRSAYAGFVYRKDFSWHCNPRKPVGINPRGCTKKGHSIDGVIPDDQRRGGRFQWPPPKENYVYEGLQGAIVQAVILHRLGYDTFDWEDKALLRAYKWLYDEADFPATGDDTWQMPLVDCFYGTSFWNGKKTRFGKNIGWTGWTHTINNPVCLK